MRRNPDEYDYRWREPDDAATDRRQSIDRLADALDPTDAGLARQEALHHLAAWRDEMPDESRQAADAALALVGAASQLLDDTAAAERLTELAGLLEHLEQQPPADRGSVPAPSSAAPKPSVCSTCWQMPTKPATRNCPTDGTASRPDKSRPPKPATSRPWNPPCCCQSVTPTSAPP